MNNDSKMPIKKNNAFTDMPEIEKVFSTTPAQMEIWLACKLGGKEANQAYNESVSLTLKGDLSVKVLQDSFLKVIERHDAMRAVLSPNGKSLIIFDKYSLPIRMRDISGMDAKEKELFLKKHLDQTGSFNFNLVQGPLYVMDLIKLEDNEHLLTFTGHHLIFDGWSLGVMLEELGKIYSDLILGDEPHLPKAELLSDYAREYFSLMRSPSYKKTKDFWKNYLSNPVPRLDLPIDKARTKIRTYNSEVHKKWLKEETLNKIKTVGTKLNSSLNLTLLAIFEIFLSDWTKQKDIIVGLPVAGQISSNKHYLIGHCVSLLPLRSKIDMESSFSDYLKVRKDDYFKTLAHSSISFGDMIKEINLERDPSRIPLVPVTFNIDTGMEDDLEFKGLEHHLMTNPKVFANFELILNLFESSNKHVLDWTFNKNLFNRSTIEKASDRYFEMIDLFLDNPDEKISALLNLSAPKIEQSEPDFETLGRLISKQLSSKKEKVAVRIGLDEYTYEELLNRSSAISKHLILKGAGPGKIVGVHLERTFDLVASALAVIQIGACYMPIDGEFPEERVKFMLSDVDVVAFITDNETYSWGDLEDRKITLEKSIFQDKSPAIEMSSPHANDPIFIVYTSGSTGKPKGVALSQQNLADFIKHFEQAPGLVEEDVVIGLTSTSFDMSFLEIVLPFVFGASLHLFDKFERRDPREIVKTVKTGTITKLFATPSHLKSIVEYGLSDKHENLTIISAGEPLQYSLAQSLVNSAAKVFNIYGPTETTIFTNIKEISPDTEVITIGKPVEGTNVFLLDDQGEIVTKTEEPGELYIGGKGVGIGYINREDLTKERFIIDPLPSKPGIYYKTGDLAVWTDDGELICKGRIDYQVKIRGQRVELGEIENMIANNSDVKNVIVEKVIDENGDDSLVAFVSFKNDRKSEIDPSIWIDACKESLSKVLSGYMIPGHFIVVDSFELNPNGKIDRLATRKLLDKPEKEVESKPSDISNIKISETVLKVKELWEEVLISSDSRLDVDFFQVGGHSLLAVDLISKIEKQFGLNLPLSLLFEHSTISSISKKLDELLSHDGVESGVLVKIKDGNPDKVMFFIHGVGLNPLEINTLNKYMDEDQTIWGLQSPTILNSEIDPIDTIEGIAKLYIAEIKNQGFNGPFKLLGNSIGGQIAFEMAKQWLKKGEEIAFLGMIDTIASITNDIPKTFSAKVKMLAKKLLFEFKFLLEDPIFYLNYRFNYLKEKIDKSKNPIPKEDSSSLKSRISQIEDANMIAWKKYKHEYIDADVTVFLAKKRTFFVSDFKSFGWLPYVRTLRTIHMPGEHANMLKPPHGEEFSRALQNFLNNTN